AIDGDRVAFSALGSNQTGIYVSRNGLLDVVADQHDLIPGRTDQFRTFEGVSLDRGKVAFSGRGSNSYIGIFSDLGGTLEPVVATGDKLDGKTVLNLLLADEGFSNRQLAFLAIFDDASQAIYVANLSIRAAIDIKPGGDTNRINPMNRGVIPVVILGS